MSPKLFIKLWLFFFTRKKKSWYNENVSKMFGFLRNKPLQKNGSEVAFLKCGHRAKKCGPKKRGLTPPRFVVNTHTQGRGKGVLT